MISPTNGNSCFFDTITYNKDKQRRVSYCYFGADILAAAEGDDRVYYLNFSLLPQFPSPPVKHQLLIDSKFLFETITTLHREAKYRISKNIARVRALFESGELNIIRWISAIENYAGVLTKRNPPPSKPLNSLINTDICDL